MTQKNKTGFSLIELSMVITIIAILISVLVIGGSKMILNARMARARGLTVSSPVKDIPNLGMWLETTSADSFNGSEVVNDATTITIWYDINKQSDPAHNATLGVAPVYTKNALNGLPVLRFDGATKWLSYDATFLIGNSYTIFVVEQRRSNAASNWLVAAGTAIDFRGGYNSDVQIVWGPAATQTTTAVAGYAAPIARIHSFVQTATTGRIFYLNGVNSSSNANNGLVATAPGTIGRVPSGANFFNGDIAEIIIFSRALSDKERQDVENYLKEKWGI